MKKAAAFKRTSPFIFIVALFATICFAGQAMAASSATLAVTIKGATKSGVKLELNGGDLTTPTKKTASRAGLARYTGLAKGTYVVFPKKAGYVFSPETKEVTFTKI